MMLNRDTVVFTISTASGFEQGPDLASVSLQLVEKIRVHEPAWYFIYLFILLGIYAWIRIYYGNVMIQTFQASTNFQLANKMFRSNSLLQNQLDGGLYIFYFLSMAFLLYYLELKVGLLPYGLQGGLLFLFNLILLAYFLEGYFCIISQVLSLITFGLSGNTCITCLCSISLWA